MRIARGFHFVYAVGLGLIGATVHAQTDFIQNGGFEEPQITSGFLQVNAGLMTIPGWSVVSGSVDIVKQGTNQVLDLNGAGPGEIRQSIAGLFGSATLTFIRTHGQGSQMEVHWNGAVLITITNDTGSSPVTETFTVDGTGNDMLTFRSLSGSSGGFYLDQVALVGNVVGCSTGPPRLTSQPRSTVVFPGETACLGVSLTGECPIALQWYKDDVAVPGATEPCLVYADAQVAQTGAYYVEATNALGSTRSTTVRLEVSRVCVMADGERLISGSAVRRHNSSLVSITTDFPGGLILFTTDGSEPNLFSQRYTEPFRITSSTVIRVLTYSADLAASCEGGPYEVQVLPGYSINTTITGKGRVITSPDKPLYFPDETVTITAYPQAGWKFVEWTGDAGGSAPEVTVQMDGPKSVTAVFVALPTLTTRIGGNGTIAVSPQKPYYDFGEQVELMVQPAPGWYLRAWVGGAAGNSLRTTVTMDTAKEVLAILDPVPRFVLSTSTAGGGFIEGNSKTSYLDGSVVRLRAVPAAGWQFMHWKGDASGVDPEIDVLMDSAKSVEAVFGTSISTSSAGGGRVELWPATGPYPFGSDVFVTGIPSNGNVLALWGGAASGVANPFMYKVTAPETTISAAFAPKPSGKRALAVQVVGGGAVRIDPPRNLFETGENVTVTAVPNSQWAFGSWSGAAVGEDLSVTLTMNEDKALTAEFVPGLRLETRVEGNGRIHKSPDLPSYRAGARVQLTADPASRWAFERWTGDVSASENPLRMTMDDNKSLCAVLHSTPGAELWSVSIGLCTAPALEPGGLVLVDGRLALDERSGGIRWVSQTPGNLCTPTVGGDGFVCVLAPTGIECLDDEGHIWDYKVRFELNLLDAKTGTKKWNTTWFYDVAAEGGDPSPSAASSPVAFSVSGVAYFVSQLENLYGGTTTVHIHSLDWLTGVVSLIESGNAYWLPYFYDSIGIPSPSIGGDHTVYARFPGPDSYSAVSPRSWTFGESEHFINQCPLAIGANGMVYLGSDDGNIYAVDRQTGEKRWSVYVGSPLRSSPSIGIDATVYVGCDNGKLYAFDGTTGTKRWEFATGGPVRSTPAITADGKVYFGSGDGKVYALNATTGAKDWDFETGGPVYSSPAVGNDGTIYIGSNDGKLYAIVGTAPLADSPWPMFMHDPQHTGSAEPRTPNRAPVISFIPDLCAKASERMVIECVCTDPDMPMERLTWSLSKAPLGARIRSYDGVFTWRPTADQGPGIHTVTVRVTDNGVPALTDEKSFRITVLDPERTLVNGLYPAQPGHPETEWNLYAAPGSEDRPGILEYLYGHGNFTQVFDAEDVCWLADPGPTGQVELLAIYSAAAQALRTATLDGSQISDSIISGPPAQPDTPSRTGTTVSFTPLVNPFLWASDAFPEGRWFSGPWLNGADANRDHMVTFSVTGYLTTPGEPATFVAFPGPVWVIAFEDGADGDYDFNDLVVEVHGVKPGPENQPPALDVIPDQVVEELSPLLLTATAYDPNLSRQNLRFALPIAPDGASINQDSGLITWRPSEAQGPGTYTFTVEVTDDGVPPLSDTKSFQVTVNEVNAPPAISAIADRTIDVGQTVSVLCTAVDPDIPVNTLTWQLVEGPTGATINAATGELTWTSEQSHAGQTFRFTVRVTDNGTPPLSDQTSFQVSVNPIPAPDPTGIQWALVPGPYSGRLWGVEYGAGLFVAVGATGTVLTSPDGLTWTQRATPTTETLWGLKYGCGRFVVAGHNGVILTSTNGIDWESSASGVTAHLTDVAFAGETCVVVGNFNTILTSLRGEGPWTVQPVNTTNHFQDVIYGGGYFVASGTAGLIATSPDGLTWTVRDSGTTNGVPMTAYGNGVWVVGGEKGILLKSTNLVEWEQVPSGVDCLLAGASHANGRFVVVGGVKSGMSGGVVLVSTNGLDWLREEAEVFPMLQDVAYGAGIWVAVGENGGILRSVQLFPPWALDIAVAGGGTVVRSPDSTLYDDGQTVTLTAVPDLNWRFTGWSGDASGSDNPLTVVMNTNKTVRAMFSPTGPTYQLAVETWGSGHVDVTPLKQSYQAGETVHLKAVPAEGWAFCGWLRGVDQVEVAEADLTMSSDKTVAASFGAPPLFYPPEFSGDCTVDDQGNCVTSENSAVRVRLIAEKQGKTPYDEPANFVRIDLLPGAPANMALAESGDLEDGRWFADVVWTPTEEQGPGIYTVSAEASACGGNTIKSFTIIVNEVNSAPVLASVGIYGVGEGRPLTVYLRATDPDIPKQNLTFGLENGPRGATVDPTTGFLSWTPGEDQGPGEYAMTVVVTDDGHPALSDRKTLRVTVNEVNSPPLLASVADKTVNEGELVLFTAQATDSDVPLNRLTYSLAPDAPEGATIDSNTGAFYWRPSEAQGPGTYMITVRVTDDGSPALSNTATFKTTVLEVNEKPVLSPVGTQYVEVGETLTVHLTAKDNDLPPNNLSYSFATTEPSGATLDALTGVLTWTPTSAFASTTNRFTVRVRDDGVPELADTVSFDVVVGPNRSIRITALGSQNGQFVLQVVCDRGRTLFVEASADLVHWSLLTTIIGTGAPVEIEDLIVPGQQCRFYRVVAP